MTGAEYVSVITMLTTFGLAVVAYFNRRLTMSVKEDVREQHLIMNSRLDELVVAVGKEKLLLGQQQGVAQEQARVKSKDEGS